MQEKGIKKFLLIASCILMISVESFPALAAGNDSIKKSITYTTNDKEDKRMLFPIQMEENEEQYLLNHVEYNIISQKPVTKEEKVEKVVRSKPIKELVAAQEEITEDGITYKLVETTTEDLQVKDASVQEVNGSTSYDYKVTESNVPQTKVVQTKDVLNGEVVTVTCSLVDITQGEPEWKDSTIAITYRNYDADEFSFLGTTVGKNEFRPLGGYENLLLQSVGLNPSNSRIVNVWWSGEPYYSGGVICRDGTASVQTLGPTYVANYTGTIEHQEETAVIYTSTYEGVKEVATGDMEYEIEAEATYTIVEKNVAAKVVAGIALLLFLLLIVLVIYLLSKEKNRRGKQDERKFY